MKPASGNDSTIRWCHGLALIILCAIALAVRCFTWGQVFYNGHFIANMPDVYYHLRIIELIYHGKLFSPLFDWYVNFPSGGLVYWPLGFDLLFAMMGYPFYLIYGNTHSILPFMSLYVPILGTLTVYIIYRANRELTQDRFMSVLIALFAVFSMALIGNSAFGRIDHHVMESLVYALTLLATIYLVRERRTGVSIVLGMLLGASLWMWNGGIFHAALAYLAIGIAFLFSKERRSLFLNWRDVSLTALITGSIVVFSHGALWANPFSTVYLSWFHILCLACGCIAPFLLYFLFRLFDRNRFLYRVFIVVILLLSGIAILTLILNTDLGSVFMKGNPVTSLAIESEELFQYYGISGILFQPLIFLAPVVFVVLAFRFARKTDPYDAALLVLLLATAVAAITQFRFVIYLELTSAVAIGSSVRGWTNQRPTRRTPILVGILFLSLLPLSYLYSAFDNMKPTVPQFLPMQQAVQWLRNHSPITSNYLHPNQKPEPGYCVYTPNWGYGHFIIFYGHRPVLATPFGGTDRYTRGSDAAIRCLFAETESQLYDCCVNLNIHYVICTDLTYVWEKFRSYYQKSTGMENVPGKQQVFMNKLLEWNNARTGNLKNGPDGFQHFRLIYNSPYLHNGSSVIRLYEVVKGTTVEIPSLKDDGEYIASVVLMPRFGKPVLWRSPVLKNKDGQFFVHCPFSTTRNGDLKAISPLEVWELRSLKVIYRTKIRESDIMIGNIVRVHEVAP